MFIVFLIVLSLCAVKLRMLFHVVDPKKRYFVYGAGIGGVLFFWKQNTLFFDPHASVPVPVPFEWLINLKLFHVLFRVRRYRHW
jgi:apolipoprotein N-acyltransferase